MTWFRETGAFDRHPTTKTDWETALPIAIKLMEYPNYWDYWELDYRSDRPLDISSRVGLGRINYGERVIGIGTGIAYADTSINFRVISLGHEIGHSVNLDSPQSLLRSLKRSLPTWFEWTLKLKLKATIDTDKTVNQFVFDNVGQVASDEERRVIMYKWVEELLFLRRQSSSPSDVKRYMNLVLPFAI